jgi:hypothetical protein
VHGINNFVGITLLGLYGDEFYLFYPDEGFPWPAVLGIAALIISLYFFIGKKSNIPTLENIIE